MATFGLSTYRVFWPANTTGVNIKAQSGQVKGWLIQNTNAAARYVKLYDKATAPTVGTDTPTQTIVVPATSSVNLTLDPGIGFGSGIGIGVSTGQADNDSTAPSANDVLVHLFYF